MGQLRSKDVYILYLGSVFIEGKMRCKTGLHIGGSEEGLTIGGIDRYVIKNPIDATPYLPGSSLKGKMRSLSERYQKKPANRGRDKIYRYEAKDADEAIQCSVSRVFGATSEGGKALNFPARLTVRDTQIQGKRGGDYELEIKSENTLDRLSAHANPRTIERVTKGATFPLRLQYDVEVVLSKTGEVLLGVKGQQDKIETFWKYVADDLNLILDALCLTEFSALGGHGSRGYGQVKFKIKKFKAKTTEELLGLKPPDAQSVAGWEEPTERDEGARFKKWRDDIKGIVEQFNGAYQSAIEQISFSEEDEAASDEEETDE